MFAFRFNPVFDQCVMVGGVVLTPRAVQPAHLLDVGSRDGFVAATYPRQPFILEPAKARAPHPQDAGMLYAEQAPVGEYELLLYNGPTDFFIWTSAEWDGWLKLVQQRIRQLHHNPYLHHLHLTL